MIAIISDSHDNLANLEEFLKQAKQNKVETILHCGDVTTPEFLSFLADNFSGQIKIAIGNAEIREEEFCFLAEENSRLEIFSEIGEMTLPLADSRRLKVAFVHKPELAENLANSGNYDYVFYGHTHQPWLVKDKKDVILANPGTLGGVFSEPTYALLDPETGRLRLKKLFR